MEYRFVATTLEGFIQQLAVAYIPHGYYFYVSGFIPEGKDPEAVDRKLLDKYGIRLSKFARCRRKALGQASIQYLRFERFYVLIATAGRHPFHWEDKYGGEANRVRDVRCAPIRFAGYSISSRLRPGSGLQRVVSVRIDLPVYLEMRDALVELATKRSKNWLEYQFRAFPFEPYAPVRRQVVSIFNRINKRRRTANLEPIDRSCLRLRRRPIKPFGLPSTIERPALPA